MGQSNRFRISKIERLNHGEMISLGEGIVYKINSAWILFKKNHIQNFEEYHGTYFCGDLDFMAKTIREWNK
jgi:hypothetical protein